MVFSSKQYGLKLTGKNWFCVKVIVLFGIENMVNDVWIEFW